MKKAIIIIVIAIVCIGFLIVPNLIEGKEEQAPVQKTETDDRLQVTSIVIEDAPLDNNLRITGSLIANETVTLKSEVAGIVENIYFEEGQRVKKGQLLIQLDNDEIVAEIQRLQHTRKLNEDMENRQKQLLAKEAISQEEYETSLTTLNEILADIKLKQVQLSKRQIRAPFDGIVGLRSISEGSYLNPADNIATLYSINPMKIEFSVPGKYASQISGGDKISFTVDGSEDTFTGKIYAVEPQVDPQTRTLKARALSANEEGKLFPGQFAKIQLTLDTYESALMIPTIAVIPEMNGKKVFVYKNGMAETKNIETGIRTADKIQVLDGLSVGDTIITSGLLQLKSGMPVNLTTVKKNQNEQSF